jgi:2-oxoglutarate ferredoxin oxidoreductase subunit alpha
MDKRFMKGNEAIAESAIRAGCRFFAGYPITPQNEIPEYMARKMAEVGGVFVQGESEIASAYMIYGGSSMGTRCMTSSSGLGLSLKAEALSYMAGSRLPAVVVNVSRGGPGLGTIQPAQQDYLFMTKGLGSGGFQCMVYAPASVQEAADVTYKAFDMAQRDRNPVIILADGCLGAMMEAVVLPESKPVSNKPEWSLAKSSRPYRSIHSFNINPLDQELFNKELEQMYLGWEKDAEVELYQMDDAQYVIAAYGISGRIAKSAVQILRDRGIAAGLVRPITVNPFPKAAFASLDPQKVKKVLTVEMSIPGQMALDVKNTLGEKIPVSFFGRSGGVIVEEGEIADALEAITGKV